MKWVVLALLAACVPQTELAQVVGKPLLNEEQAAAPQEAQVEIEVATLPNLGPAPEFQNEVWLNTERPLRLAELRGNVVLLDMWTFG